MAVTGTVADITKDFAGDAKVSLEVGFLKTVDCNFGENTKAISKLGKEEEITVIGVCNGFIMKQVILDNCEVWE